MDLIALRYAIGVIILGYATYAIVLHFISIFKYKAQIIFHPKHLSWRAFNRCWRVGDDIWWAPMLIVILLFGLGLTLLDFFGLIGPPA